MARPKKPRIGTVERLEIDMAAFGETWGYVAREIRRDPIKWGSKSRAFLKAAEEFKIDVSTAKAHHTRVCRALTPAATREYKLRVARELPAYGPSMIEAIEVVCSAFTEGERRELGSVSIPLVVEFARLRLASRKRKRK